MDKKVLVLDLDGTLTNSEKQVTPRTKDAIRRMQEEGHTVVLASGRPRPGVEPLAKELELEKFGGYILPFNGGQIIECKTGKVIYQQTLPEEVVPELFAMAEELEIGLLTYTEDHIIANAHKDEYTELEGRINHLEVTYHENIVELIDFPVNKCLGTANPEIAPQKEQAYIERFGERLCISRSEAFFIEINPKGVDKAASLERFCEIIGTTKENMIACGDGFNDLSMIQYAGLGVAMENAKESVKEAADYITASNDEDGVALVIEKFIL